MEIKDNFASKAHKYFDHFESLANGYDQYRKKYNYYYNDIINYCNYFIHEENSVLEIGCGTGSTISQLKGKRKVGIDYSPKMIENAKKHYNNVEFHA